MSRSPEALLSEKILKALNAMPEALFVKRPGTGLGHAGLADITGCVGGVHVEIEVKKSENLLRVGVSGGVRPKQHRWLLRWRNAGARVGTASSVEGALEIARGRTWYSDAGQNLYLAEPLEELL